MRIVRKYWLPLLALVLAIGLANRLSGADEHVA